MPSLNWNEDGVLWANEPVTWGLPDPPGPQPETPILPEPAQPREPYNPPQSATIYLHLLLHIESNPPLRLTTFWTEEVEIGGETWLGGLGFFNFNVSSIGVRNDGRTERSTLTAQLGENSQVLRKALLQPVGGQFASVDMIYSTDLQAWHILPNRVRGRLSNSRIQGGQYSVDIVSETLEAYNRKSLVWSHEDQLQRTGGQDIGFKDARPIAEGKRKTRFPNWQGN